MSRVVSYDKDLHLLRVAEDGVITHAGLPEKPGTYPLGFLGGAVVVGDGLKDGKDGFSQFSEVTFTKEGDVTLHGLSLRKAKSFEEESVRPNADNQVRFRTPSDASSMGGKVIGTVGPKLWDVFADGTVAQQTGEGIATPEQEGPEDAVPGGDRGTSQNPRGPLPVSSVVTNEPGTGLSTEERAKADKAKGEGK